MHELEVFCEMTFFDFKLPIFCTAFDATRQEHVAKSFEIDRPKRFGCMTMLAACALSFVLGAMLVLR